ncbi:penicillin-binding protein activator [Pseudoalteromonas tunicata]|uniref:penicillin-binding protein activator n=1 Tax=Pseudoalteromonas tunicata TaxID=314281 RepID=UPI000320E773|nr:penicillin-binding protein activator [Pseudoalteromonas tunicata]AXT32381.1 penicillin-binding protein activator [Pseudoalteromonas tunicata]MDP4983064.1 penicillin-binding protein activator [Pseudoalteromonas tunicata]
MRLKHSSFILLFSLLSACSTTDKTAIAPQTVEKPTNKVANKQFDAQALYESTRLKRGVDKIQLLYAARDKAIDEQKWSLLEIISNELIKSQGVDRTQNTLYLALAQFKQRQYASALSLLDEQQDKMTSPVHFYWHQYISGQIYAAQALTLQALPFLFRASETAEKHQLPAQDLNRLVWQQITQLPAFTLQSLQQGSNIQQGWVNLALYSQLYVGNPIALHSAMNNWQRRYPHHPASFALPEKMQNLLEIEPFAVKKLAVLLPLKDEKNRRNSEAISNGILAATTFNQGNEVHFIDSEQNSDDLKLQLSQLQPDFIVGPLLRENISRLENDGVLTDYPVIFLNSSEQPQAAFEHFYFALSPEHEINQAIEHFLTEPYKKPLILAPQNRSGTRLIEYFQNQWQQYSEVKPEVALYSSTKDLQQQVRQLLEVDKSQQRISTINLMFKEKLHSEPRSRRDFDVIYIIADAVKTRLLKPYFDVSISTFAEQVPIYAMSRSHSPQVDKSDKRDLQGLYFTDMPWMIPNTHTAAELRSQFDSLWQDNNDLQQQLFAMGYDAVKLIPELRQLNALPGKGVQGLTGRLSVNDAGAIERQLQWAQYQKDSIITVERVQQKPTPLFMLEPLLNSVQNDIEAP